jgi:cephalosporin hydroxylase
LAGIIHSAEPPGKAETTEVTIRFEPKIPVANMGRARLLFVRRNRGKRMAGRQSDLWSAVFMHLPGRAAKECRRLAQQVAAGRSALPAPMISSIQHGSAMYEYKGLKTVKNPFDFALYPMLLWRERPKTIIEIGSYNGGSAVWLSDVMQIFGAPCAIHSIDVKPVIGVSAPGVTFHRGDAYKLGELLNNDFMNALARPLMVIEDADHTVASTLAVLHFFDRWLRPGEYILVEDSILTDMGIAGQYAGGPLVAIEQFLAERGGDYMIDRSYCDFFGQNMTWNVNGYLKRLR